MGYQDCERVRHYVSLSCAGHQPSALLWLPASACRVGVDADSTYPVRHAWPYTR